MSENGTWELILDSLSVPRVRQVYLDQKCLSDLEVMIPSGKRNLFLRLFCKKYWHIWSFVARLSTFTARHLLLEVWELTVQVEGDREGGGRKKKLALDAKTPSSAEGNVWKILCSRENQTMSILRIFALKMREWRNSESRVEAARRRWKPRVGVRWW